MEDRETYTTLAEQELEQRFITEMTAIMTGNPQPATLQLLPGAAYTLIGLLQLCCRNPGVTGYTRQVANQVAHGLAGMFDVDSAIGESIRRGWVEEYDQPKINGASHPAA